MANFAPQYNIYKDIGNLRIVAQWIFWSILVFSIVPVTFKKFFDKYILIDPKTKPKGFICTNNFTENGFAKNPELAVELNKEQCEELFKVFVYHFWEHSTDEQTATTEFEKVKPANKFTLSRLNNILLTSPNSQLNTLNEALKNAVKNAKKINFFFYVST